MKISDVVMTCWDIRESGYCGVPSKRAKTITLDRIISNNSTYHGFKEISQEEKDKMPMLQGISFGQRLIKNPDNGQQSGEFLKANPQYNAYLWWNGFYACDVDVDKSKSMITDTQLYYFYESMSKYKWFVCCCRSTGGKGLHIYTAVEPKVDRNNVVDCEWSYIKNAKRINNIVKEELAKFGISGWADNAMVKISQGIHYSQFYKYINNNIDELEVWYAGQPEKTFKLCHGESFVRSAPENKFMVECEEAFEPISSLKLHSPYTWQLAQTIAWWFTNPEKLYPMWRSQCSTDKPFHYQQEWNNGMRKPKNFKWAMDFLISLGYDLEAHPNIGLEENDPLDLLKKYKKI